jgi:hypothetical protein
MSGASIETTLELWASALRDVKARMRPLFLQERMARSAGLFLDGLLGPERRKTGSSACAAAPGLDVCRGCGGPGPVAAAVGAWSRPVGRGRVARRGAGLGAGNLGGPGSRAGD